MNQTSCAFLSQPRRTLCLPSSLPSVSWKGVATKRATSDVACTAASTRHSKQTNSISISLLYRQAGCIFVKCLSTLELDVADVVTSSFLGHAPRAGHRLMCTGQARGFRATVYTRLAAAKGVAHPSTCKGNGLNRFQTGFPPRHSGLLSFVQV